MTCAEAPKGDEWDRVPLVTACGFTDLLSPDADEDGLGPILLAAAETDDVGNLEAGRQDEELCPRLSLITTEHPRVCQRI